MNGQLRRLSYVLLAIGLLLIAAASLLSAPAPVQAERDVPPETVKGDDFNGEWAMLWDTCSFRQTLDKTGFAECLGSSVTFIGSWTSARAGELTISETWHTLPEYVKNGEEVTFTLAVKRAVRKGNRLVRVELEGPYQSGTVKVVLTPYVFREK